MLKYRILTVIIAIPLLFLAIWYLPPFYFAVLMAALVAVSAWEWAGLMSVTIPSGLTRNDEMRGTNERATGVYEVNHEDCKRVCNKADRFSRKSRFYMRAVYVLIVLLGLYFVLPIPIFPVFVLGLLVWLWAAVGVIFFNRGKVPCGFQRPEVQAIAGFIILVNCWLVFINLRLGAGEFGATRLMLGLIIIFAADTGAYFIGRFCGKHALASRVSPKKTWEGLVGGFVLALVVAIIATFFMPMPMSKRLIFWGLGILIALFSMIGDLTVSMLKRQNGLKDSGKILPGHGGLMDRVDSIAPGLLIFALGLLVLEALS